MRPAPFLISEFKLIALLHGLGAEANTGRHKQRQFERHVNDTGPIAQLRHQLSHAAGLGPHAMGQHPVETKTLGKQGMQMDQVIVTRALA